jgi:hypothetical protein
MLTEVFLSFAITTFVSCVLAITALLYRSKCEEVSCCGCKVIRDVKGEEKLDELNIERHRDISLQETKNNNNI